MSASCIAKGGSLHCTGQLQMLRRLLSCTLLHMPSLLRCAELLSQAEVRFTPDQGFKLCACPSTCLALVSPVCFWNTPVLSNPSLTRLCCAGRSVYSLPAPAATGRRGSWPRSMPGTAPGGEHAAVQYTCNCKGSQAAGRLPAPVRAQHGAQRQRKRRGAAAPGLPGKVMLL